MLSSNLPVDMGEHLLMTAATSSSLSPYSLQHLITAAASPEAVI